MKVLSGGVGSPAKGAASSDEAPAGPKRGHFRHPFRSLKARADKAVGSRLAAITLLDQGFSSLSNFAVGVAVARGAGAAGLGGFTFAYAGWLVLSAMHRSLITDPMAIEGDIRNSKTNVGVKKGFAAEMLLGVSAAICFVLIGGSLLVIGQHTYGYAMLVLAPWLPFLVVQDYWRWVGFMSRRPGKALANDTVFNVVQALAFGAVFVFHKQSEATLISSWGLGAAAGAVYGLRQNRMWPAFRGGLSLLRARWSVSKWIASSALTFWGSSQMYVLVAGVILGCRPWGPESSSGPGRWPLRSTHPGRWQCGLAGGHKGVPGKRLERPHPGGATRHHGRVPEFCRGSRGGGAVRQGIVGPHLRAQFAQYEATAILFAIAYIFIGFFLGPILVLKATRQTRQLFVIQIVSLVVSVVTTVAFCVLWGVNGAAAAVLVTYAATAATYRFFVRRAHHAVLQENGGEEATLRLDDPEPIVAEAALHRTDEDIPLALDGPEPVAGADLHRPAWAMAAVTPLDERAAEDDIITLDELEPFPVAAVPARMWARPALPASARQDPTNAVRSPAARRRQRSPEEKRLQRVRVVWALLFFNVLSFAVQPIVFPIPHSIGQLLTQGSLALAFLLALTVNPRLRVRPNLFLSLYTLLAITTLMMSVRLISFGTAYRGFRLLGFLAVLWLLTPWWGRKDLLFLRVQVRFLVGILASVVLGLLLAPHKAYVLNAGARRLDGALWPMPATQVGHYMAELTGLVILLWLCGLWTRRRALPVLALSFGALLLSHTRTALLGLVIGLVIAGLSLLTSSRRVRRAFAAVVLITVTLVLPLSPVLSSWLVRGESTTEVSNLSGRTEVWPQVLSEPRPETNKIFGSGMGNGGVIGALNPAYDGLPIDGSWIATYQNQGIVGIVLEAAMFIVLLLIALLRPRSPARAMALFLIVYCLVASFTETGLGDASTYLLDLALAASLLTLPLAKKVKWKPSLRVTA